jgi:hypothetical protein
MMCMKQLMRIVGLWAGLALLGWAMPLFADWSGEIVLWDTQRDLAEGPMETRMEIDSAENVHIVFQAQFYPGHPRDGLIYTQFDDHGHVLVPPFILNDTLFDWVANRPNILFFGADSLWVHCRRYFQWGTVFYDSLMHITLDYRGHVIGPWAGWPRTLYGMNGYYITVCADTGRRVACVYPDLQQHLRLTVRNPDGTNRIDEAVINVPPWENDAPDAYVDATDSLQLAWRQRDWYWDAVVATRIDMTHTYDTSLVSQHVALTPEQDGQLWGLPEWLRARDDSLLTLNLGGPGNWCMAGNHYLRVMRRSDYHTISQVDLGCTSYVNRTVEHDLDNTISGFTFPEQERRLHFRRFSYPDLANLDDSLFITLGEHGMAVWDYAVSPSGTRHVVYRWDYAPNRSRLIYRYWREDLSAEPQTQHSAARPEFSVRPNPASTEFSLEGPLATVKALALYNVLGQEVMRLRPQSGAAERWDFRELSSLPSGSYYLHISTLHGKTVQKVIMRPS